jgi:hypothetical protein
MSLATIADLEAVLHREIDDEDVYALAALEQASAVVEGYLGYPVELVEDEEVVLDGSGTKVLLLPSYPVTDVASVTVDGEVLDVEDYEWSRTGELRRSGTWPVALRSVEVTYSHGYATVPALIVAVVAALAGRIYATPLTVRQESMGAYSVTYSGNGGPSLQAAELMMLDAYRRWA